MKVSKQRPPDQKQSAVLTPDQALSLLGKVISRASFYQAIRRGDVPHRRLGKKILIPRVAFVEWLETPAVMERPTVMAGR